MKEKQIKDKMLQVDGNIHQKAKNLAKESGMTIRGFIKMLVLGYEKRLNEKK